MGPEQIAELNRLLASLLVIDSTAAMSKVVSRKDGSRVNPGEQAELLKKFMEFNPELQRGMLSYAERMRRGYRKGA